MARGRLGTCDGQRGASESCHRTCRASQRRGIVSARSSRRWPGVAALLVRREQAIMKRNPRVLRYWVSGFVTAVVLSLAYLLFGSWDIIGWSPEPLWAKILFSPGVAAGHLSWNHLTHSEVACRAVGVGAMGYAGGIIGLVLHVVIRKEQSKEVDGETSGT